jgi:hypothetical protein
VRSSSSTIQAVRICIPGSPKSIRVFHSVANCRADRSSRPPQQQAADVPLTVAFAAPPPSGGEGDVLADLEHDLVGQLDDVEVVDYHRRVRPGRGQGTI